MEERHKEICLKFLQKQKYPKMATMVTPYWTKRLQRMEINGKKAILSYEIYSQPSKPSEHSTIRALNALVEEGKAEMKVTDELVWYAAKE